MRNRSHGSRYSLLVRGRSSKAFDVVSSRTEGRAMPAVALPNGSGGSRGRGGGGGSGGSSVGGGVVTPAVVRKWPPQQSLLGAVRPAHRRGGRFEGIHRGGRGRGMGPRERRVRAMSTPGAGSQRWAWSRLRRCWPATSAPRGGHGGIAGVSGVASSLSGGRLGLPIGVTCWRWGAQGSGTEGGPSRGNPWVTAGWARGGDAWWRYVVKRDAGLVFHLDVQPTDAGRQFLHVCPEGDADGPVAD